MGGPAAVNTSEKAAVGDDGDEAADVDADEDCPGDETP